jgi:uncharacterized membrane protein
LIAAAYLFGVYVFMKLPHLNPPDLRQWSWPLFPRILHSFFWPTAALAILLIVKSVASKDPFRANYVRFRRTYEVLLDTAVVLIIGVQLLLIVSILPLTRFAPRMAKAGTVLELVPTVFIGIILIIAGNILPRLRPNSAMGIRTPWALRDERVWTRTHRAGGYLAMLFGLAIILVTFIEFQGIWWVILPGLAVALLGLPLLSYVLWRRRPTTPSA